MKRILFLLFLLIAFSPAYSEQIIKTVDLSLKITNPSRVGVVQVARDTRQNKWAVLWIQSKPVGDMGEEELLYGRLVSGSGALSPMKKISSTFPINDFAFSADLGEYMMVSPYTAQALTPALVKKGGEQELPVSNSGFSADSQVLYDATSKSFDVYYLVYQGSIPSFYYVKLDASGKAGKAVKSFTMTPKRTILSSEAFRNPSTNNTLLLVHDYMQTGPPWLPHLVQAYVIRPTGSLQKKWPVFSSPICTSPSFKVPFLEPSAAFDASGAGIISWTVTPCTQTSQDVSFRRIKAKEQGLTAASQVSQSPLQQTPNAINAIVLDEINNEYVVLWHEAGALKASRIPVSGGAAPGSPVTLATVKLASNAAIWEISASYDRASGTIIAVWSETLGASSSQIRAVLFKK